MKRLFCILTGIAALCVLLGLNFQSSAQSLKGQINQATQVSPNIVISQFQTAGGTDGDEFIELHNTSSSSFDLNGFRLVYRSTGGTNDVSFAAWTTSTVIAPGAYYLITSTTYDGSAAADRTYNSGTCQCALGAGGGGLAIRNSNGIVFDSVGYGTATNAFVETTRTAAPAANASAARINNGCQDTDNNLNDFAINNPSAPRNASTAPNICGGGGTTILIGGGASPSTIAPGATTLLTVSVQPATTPPSTGITVTGNLSNIGLSANQQFFDNGTNGDVTAGDNVFSYTATIPANASGGTFTVTGTAADAQSRSASVNINVTINAPAAGEDYLLLGNPSNATSDVNFPSNYLLSKPQYAMSYDRDRAIPNWVAWRLDSTWIGSAPRQDDFRPDSMLPAGWYQATDNDYSGSGFDRGHHTPSGDRTRTVADNSATFLMTNIMPQAGGNNQGPWNDLENYCRTLAQAGNELYIFAGGFGQGGTGSNGFANTIAGGHITVPSQTWKVIVVLPNGNNDLQRVTTSTRTIAVIMPNADSIRNQTWQSFETSIDQVETLTGLDFLSNVPMNIQNVIEARVGSPTAAAVTISGRVSFPQTFGTNCAFVTLTDSQGNSRTTVTGKFGGFGFDDVAVGETYILRAFARHQSFAPQVITPTEDLTDLSFAP